MLEHNDRVVCCMKKIVCVVGVLWCVLSWADERAPVATYASESKNQLISSNVAQSQASQSDTTSALQATIDTSAQGGQASSVDKKSLQKAVDNAAGDAVKAQAFSTTVSQLMPLTPAQIKALHEYYRETKNAVHSYPGVPPKPTSSTQVVDLSPGATPPSVRMSSGFISTLNFVDASGQPWPITGEDLGDPKNFNIQVTKEGTALLVQSLSDARMVANLAVMLKGLSTPVMITLLSGQSRVDYRMDFRIPKLGPNAKVQMSLAPNTVSSQLLQVLDGIAPANAHTLRVSDNEIKAWSQGNNLYLRTTGTLISPSFSASVQSGDGTHAYQLPHSAVILVMKHGQIQKINIGDELS